MITRKQLVPLAYLEKEPFTGSDKGMRFLLRMEKTEEEKKLVAYVWPQPFCFDKTPKEGMRSEAFPFSEEGLVAVADYLTGIHDEVVS